MTPVYIAGCFGWLHLPDKRPASGRGVVLCNTLGNEAMNVHRAWVLLAEKLADAGLPALRFDYPGTGDSVAAEETITLSAWIRSVVEAASWLKAQTGITEVALCGVRAGATLATLAAPRIDRLERMALLAPVVSGRTYLRALTITARAWDAIWMVEQPIEHDGWFEAAGLRCPAGFKRELGTVDLLKLSTAPAARVLILDAGDGGAVQTFAGRLESLGTTIEQHTFAGSEALMRDALESEVPHAVFDSLSRWLAKDAPPNVRGIAPPAADAVIELDHATEQPVRFGDDNELFGIYTTPRHTPTGDYTLLILNTGGHSHVGHSRNAVTLARRLARAGVPSLRMDASGIGDSDPRTGENGRFYDASAIEDTRAGVDWLVRKTGRRVVILGLCSGAYNALQLGVSDSRVAGLVLGNQQRFVWSSGSSLRVVQRSTRRTTEFYLRNIRSSRVWRRLLRADIDVLGISRTLAVRALCRVRSAVDPLLAPLGIKSRFSLVRSWFRILDRRDVPILIALSFNDPGIDELEEYFGAHGGRLNAFPHIKVVRLDNTDHTLSHHASREVFFSTLSEWLDASLQATSSDQAKSPALAAE